MWSGSQYKVKYRNTGKMNRREQLWDLGHFRRFARGILPEFESAFLRFCVGASVAGGREAVTFVTLLGRGVLGVWISCVCRPF